MNGQRQLNLPILLAFCQEHTDNDINSRIANDSVAFGKLRGNVWIEVESGLTLSWKSTNCDTESLQTVILPTLLYSYESLIVYEHQAKNLTTST